LPRSLVIDQLQNLCKYQGRKIAYLYFDYKKQSIQTPLRVVSCLLKQVLSPYSSVPEQALKLFTLLKDDHSLPQWQELTTIFIDTCASNSALGVYIVLDALDECGQDLNRRPILKLIKAMRRNHVRLFVTSRPFPDDTMCAFTGAYMVEVGASDRDVKEFLSEKIGDASRLDQ
jgi:hypothetical protein